MTDIAKLIERLQDAALYNHPVSDFELLETHISWVLLTGSYAYKIKKPVNLGFVDFTALEQRRYYCFEELRLNRRLAPELYLEVCTITGTVERPVINGSGPAIEYMVKMQQFEQHDLLSHLAAQNQLAKHHIDALASTVAAFHQDIARAPDDSDFGNPKQIKHWIEQNFQQIRPLLQTTQQVEQLEQLHSWSKRSYEKLQQQLLERKKQAYIRECHGDLHLGNIALVKDSVTIFDGIEFNDELRWIDVSSEIAFLIMDLYDRGRPELANCFLDQYLTLGGDYAGLAVLPFYLVYRALVRAKIDLLRLTQGHLTARQTGEIQDEYQSYIDLALHFSKSAEPALFITHGLTGSGKSTLAARLVQELGVIRIRSDVERKRLFGLTAGAASGSSLGAGIYTADATQKTYQQVSELCEQVIKAGYSVLADAGFLQQWQRVIFQQLAQKLAVKFIILDLQAPLEILRQRVEQRQRLQQDPSEANLQVLEAQLQHQQALTPAEHRHAIIIDAGDEKFSHALTAIKQHCDNPEYHDT